MVEDNWRFLVIAGNECTFPKDDKNKESNLVPEFMSNSKDGFGSSIFSDENVHEDV